MKKLAFLVGLAVGFLLGSKTGTGPYENLEGKVRSLRARPDVADTVDRAKAAASEQVTGVVDKVNEKVPSRTNGVAV
jgi:hypothetical protein